MLSTSLANSLINNTILCTKFTTFYYLNSIWLRMYSPLLRLWQADCVNDEITDIYDISESIK